MGKKIVTLAVAGLVILFGMAGGTKAATVFIDDFEDQDHIGWSYANTGGTGSSGVSLNSGLYGAPDNYVAWAAQTSSGRTSLSQEFIFMTTDTLSFDMQARGNAGEYNTQGYSGLTIIFSDSLNLELGSFSLYYGTDGSGNLADQNWHNYSASLSQLATLAGVANLSEPTKFSLSFWSQGQRYSWGGIHTSSASVYFDNVSVSAVPIPGAAWLLGSGLTVFVALRRRDRT